MKDGEAPKKNIKIPAIKIPSMNRMKLALAAIMLVAEIVAIIGSSIYGFQVGAVTLILFAIVTYDYLRILRAEKREGPWYEIEDMEE